MVEGGSVVENQNFRGREEEAQWYRCRGSVVEEQRLSGGEKQRCSDIEAEVQG